jgi:hypothetical protein
VPAHAAVLYLRAPLAAISAAVFCLSPGLLLAYALRRGRTIGQWLLSGLALSVIALSVLTALVQTLLGAPLVGHSFSAVVGGAALLALSVALARARVRAAPPWPFDEPFAEINAAALLVAPALVVALLAPKFFWESFNGDGAHAFETLRLLLVRPLPFWGREAGDIASFPGVTSMLFAYPGSWFVRLFGAVDASARLPIVLYLPAVASGIGELARVGRQDGLRPVQWLTIWLGLAAFVLAMAFSATYNPYAADIALPATQDTLLMACFFAFVLAFIEREPTWMVLWGVLTYLSLPSGLILLVLWLCGAWLLMRPRPWPLIKTAIVTIALCVVGSAILSRLLTVFGLPAPGGEYGAVGILRYFAFLQLTDWQRLLYVAVPCGVLPALSTIAWKWQDDVTRALSFVTWAYFLFFFVQATNALHHFVPAMVIPFAVFWRIVAMSPAKAKPLTSMAAIGALAGIALSLPRSAAPHLEGQSVGETVSERIGGYERSDAEEFRHSTLLNALFPYDWDPSVPASNYGGSPLVWNRYARHDGVATAKTNYLLQRSGGALPAGWSEVARDSGAVLLVRDSMVWAGHRGLRPDSNPGSRVLAVPRWVLFRSIPHQNGPRTIDVAATLERLGFDVGRLYQRLGVKR